MAFHALAVLEVFLTLGWLLGSSAHVAQALVFEALNRVITSLFKFVPFRVGVDEASSGALAPLLGWGPGRRRRDARGRAEGRNLSWAASAC